MPHQGKHVDGKWIHLTKYELANAAFVGMSRYVDSALRGAFRPLYSDRDPFENDIESAGAESAVAKFLNLYWLGSVCDPKGPDVAPNIEVRWTPYPDGGLRVDLHNAPERPYYLVRGRMPHYEVVGWAWGYEVKQPDFLEKPARAGAKQYYLMPAHLLRSLDQRAA